MNSVTLGEENRGVTHARSASWRPIWLRYPSPHHSLTSMMRNASGCIVVPESFLCRRLFFLGSSFAPRVTSSAFFCGGMLVDPFSASSSLKAGAYPPIHSLLSRLPTFPPAHLDPQPAILRPAR